MDYIVWTNWGTKGWTPQEFSTLAEVFAHITGDQVAGRQTMVTKRVDVKLVEEA